MLGKVMGIALFALGFVFLVLATVEVIGLIAGRSAFETILLYLGGVILCILAYVMARERPPTALV